MSEPEVRALRPDERPALVDLLFRSYDDEHPPAVWETVAADQAVHEGRTLVAVVEGHLASTAYVDDYPMRVGDRVLKVGAIANVATHPRMRGRGLAERVLREAVHLTRRLGHVMGVLITPVPKYYNRFGFSIVPETRFRMGVERIDATPEGPYTTERFDPGKHIDGVMHLHETWSARFSGTRPRTREMWSAPRLWEPDDPERWLVAVRDTQVVAYLRGRKGKPAKLNEFVAPDPDAGVALLDREIEATGRKGESALVGQFPLDEAVIEKLTRQGFAVTQALAFDADKDFEIPMLAILDLAGLFAWLEPELADRARRAAPSQDVSVVLTCDSGSVGLSWRDGAFSTSAPPGAPRETLSDAQLLELIVGARTVEEIGVGRTLPDAERAFLSMLFPRRGFVLLPVDHF